MACLGSLPVAEVGLEDGRRRLVAAVREAVAAGYRLVDTSLASGMEPAVLEGVRASGVDPGEVVVATRLARRGSTGRWC